MQSQSPKQVADMELSTLSDLQGGASTSLGRLRSDPALSLPIRLVGLVQKPPGIDFELFEAKEIRSKSRVRTVKVPLTSLRASSCNPVRMKRQRQMAFESGAPDCHVGRFPLEKELPRAKLAR